MSQAESLARKRERAEQTLRQCGRAIIAFSGGVDSTLLTALARQTLGRERVLAATADSPSIARADLQEAGRLAAWLDVEHVIVATRELAHPAYRANTARRCYVCKRELFVELEELAEARGISVVLYGAIADDLKTERPGQFAAAQYRVRAPLQEAGFEKWDVRELARSLGLPNWDRPQNACLSSRIPHGMPVTEEKLRRVEEAEAMLKRLGFRQVRVRHLGQHARIEVGREELARVSAPGMRERLAEEFAGLGFSTVGIDRMGYHEGGADRRSSEELIIQTVAAV